MADGANAPYSGGATPVSIRRYVAWLWRWRVAVLLAVAATLPLASAGVSRLQLASNYEIYFDGSDPRLDALNELHRTFSRNDNVLIVLVPARGDAFSPAMLSLVHQVTEAGWRLPFAARVDSVTNFQHVTSDADGVVIRDLVPDPEGIDLAGAREVRELALAQRALVGRLVSRSGDVTGVNVRLELSGADARTAVVQVAEAARAIAARIERENPATRVRLTGNAMLNAAFPEASMHDIAYLTPFMYLVIALGIWVLLRSFRAAVVAMLMVALASLLAMGAAGWLGIAVSSASVVAPTIIATVAIADGIHLLSSFLRARAGGAPVRECVEHTMGINFSAVAVTSLTTAVGFLSLNASDAPPFRDLGNITAMGVVAAFLLSVVLLPVLLLMVPPRGSSPPMLNMSLFARWVLGRRGAALACVTLVAGACAAVIPRMELNDSFVEYFDERIPFRRDTDYVMEHLTGIYQVEFALPSGAPFGVNDPAYLSLVDGFVSWLEAQPEVMHVAAITEVLKRLNRHLAGDEYALPATRELAAQYLLLYEMSVPFGLDLNDRLDVERSVSRVTVTLRNLDNATLRDFEGRAERWLQANAPRESRAPAVGASVMFAYIAERNIHAMLQGALLAVAVIALVLAAVFASLRLGLLTLLPNLVPALIAFGIWAAAVGEMGVALAVVATMSLGVVVDDTVHFVTRFLHARRRLDLTPEAAVEHAFLSTGTALASTSAVLVAGFCVLSVSAFQVNHGMGQLTGLVLLCALVADFLMLPGLLIMAARRGWA
jgi:predicted RND superfamily exporter protein